MSLNNYCAITPNKPEPCKKNLGIKRIDMPQINSRSDYTKFKTIVQDKLGLRAGEKYVDVRRPSRPIYASQKEIHMTRARDIARKTIKKGKVPVILLKDKKDKYLVVDGHHRWLAHRFASKKSKKNRKMWSYVVEVGKLKRSFQDINRTLRKDKHNFHKRHAFKTPKGNPATKNKTKKIT
jgi:hypothetical protein